MSLTIEKTFDLSLTNPNDQDYKDLAGKIESSINEGYSKLLGYIDKTAKVNNFRAGSIIADFTINSTTRSLGFSSVNTQVSEILRNKGISLTQNAFAQCEETTLYNTTDKLYPSQTVMLNCAQSVEGEIKWEVNKIDPAQNSQKYSIVNNNTSLIVKNVTEHDRGRYSCIIQRNSIPYIQWQKIVIEQLPTINVGENKRIFPCNGKPVLLKCCVNAGYKIEWVLDGVVQPSSIESGCITLNHTIQSRNCKEETFTCRLKDLQNLLQYSYSNKNVTVKINEEFDCINEILGCGKTDDMVKGTCDIGMEGNITYKCESNKMWRKKLDNCVLKVIKDLDRKAESLVVGEIPVFVSQLSNAAEQNIDNITQSVATVSTIVEILSKIADLSQTIFIDKPVMENFLKTVDVIVSDRAKGTWQDLKNGNISGNTSIKLLQAIETISGRLSDNNFTINGTSIQLNRTKINNSFSGISQLPNSTTLVEIPKVPEPIFITIIVFTNLDNVLPTRNANNENHTSDVSLNGDVVVIKVNQTINNISFTFDIVNETLGNPQCVFWNLRLNGWDPTGCEKKTLNETDKVKCECNHTTSFSILMSPILVMSDKELDKYLSYITYIGVAISMVSLILCLIIEMTIWKSLRRNDTTYIRHVSIVNIAVSLLIADICFIIGASIAKQGQPTPEGPCTAAVFFMHFFYLALFFWMFISALLLFYRTVMILSQMSRAKMMAIAFIVGYGTPLLIAVITVASLAEHHKYITKTNACWLNWDESKALLAFVIPALTIVAINLLVLIVVLYKMLRRGVGVRNQPDEKHTLVVIARFIAILTPLFGLTWGFGIGTMVSSAFGIHVVFAILNSLQGFFVLVFGTLLDSKVRVSLSGKLSPSKLSSSRTRSTSAGTSSKSRLDFIRRMRRNVFNFSEANTF
ncbi:adhesion G protein-coupled receptor F5-like [Myxocyprinus asiaticus]|uniref:adhesion G protein-coupled receptor F5-like n=1 Tax=Myxocyprinus asiaticus TaxID=70543 RepID=UPI0022237158|nr:adhesion G protein-coupled receptor F5-like [Myxocyprinus asiaticus]